MGVERDQRDGYTLDYVGRIGGASIPRAGPDTGPTGGTPYRLTKQTVSNGLNAARRAVGGESARKAARKG